MDASSIVRRRGAARGLATVVSVALVAAVMALGGVGAGRTAAAVGYVDVEFSTQPLGANIGGGVKTGEPNVPWSVQPVVGLTGDWDPSYTYTVTLQIDPASPNAGGPGYLACSGGTTRDMFNGSAAFSGCRIDTAGEAYQVLATVDGVTDLGVPLPPMEVTSLAFNIAGGSKPAAAGISFTRQPLGATIGGPRPSAPAGRAWSVQPVVSVVDQNGDVVSTDNRTLIQLRISDGAPMTGGPGNLSCTSGTSMTVQNGVARFSGCSIDVPGTFYELTASTYSSGSTRVLSDESLDFDISGGSAGARARFTTEPLGAVLGGTLPTAPSGSPWAIQPVVSIVDSSGRVAQNDYDTIVTLAIDSQSPRGGTLACAGGVSVAVNAGVAGFYGCQITGPGAGYVLRATARSGGSSLTYDLSLPFTITSTASALDLVPSAFTLRPNQVLTLTATLAGQGAAGQSIVFQRQQPGDTGWVNLGTAQTSASGVATLTFDPQYTASYRAVFSGSGGLSAATSATDTVAVQAVVALSPTSPTTVKKGTTIKYTARVTPAPAGSATVRFLFYTSVGGVWVYSTSRSVRLSTAGVATLAWKWGTAGKWYVIATAPTTVYYAQGASKTIRVTVK
jgi:hypothetical protein